MPDEVSIIATLCFADEKTDHIPMLQKLLTLYEECEGTTKNIVVEAVREGESLVLQVDLGFSCLSMNVSDIKKLVEGE